MLGCAEGRRGESRREWPLAPEADCARLLLHIGSVR